MNMKAFFGRLRHDNGPKEFEQRVNKGNNTGVQGGTGKTVPQTTPTNNVFPSDRNILYSGQKSK